METTTFAVPRDLLAEGRKTLSKSHTPALDAEILLAHALGISREELFLNPPSRMDDSAVRLFGNFLERRKNSEPVAYITGKKDFYKSVFLVNGSVLIPRPETELLVETVLEMFGHEAVRLLEVGAGSGCIPISMALERTRWRITAVDISSYAIETAMENGKRLGVTNVEFIQSDFFDSVEGLFDVIVSNPPYIDEKERNFLMPDVRDYEPPEALFAENGGLGAIEKLLEESPRYLKTGGTLLCEIGVGQKKILEERIDRGIWKTVSFLDDLAGHPRLLIAGLE